MVRPRDAATVVVIRDVMGGIEVFCVERHARSGFLGGAIVFPGGKLDAADTVPEWLRLATEPPARASLFEEAEAPARAIAVAACRETLEEGGIVPLDRASDAAETARLRQMLASATFADVLTRSGVRLDLAALVPWARWITPEAESRRYDTRFFLLALPLGQEGAADLHETTLSFWATPSAVLERAARREIFVAPPTARTLELLAHARNVAMAFEIAACQSLLPICPRFVPDPLAPFLALPGDPAHDVRERRVDGPTRFVLRDGRFVSEEAP